MYLNHASKKEIERVLQIVWGTRPGLQMKKELFPESTWKVMLEYFRDVPSRYSSFIPVLVLKGDKEAKIYINGRPDSKNTLPSSLSDYPIFISVDRIPVPGEIFEFSYDLRHNFIADPDGSVQYVGMWID